MNEIQKRISELQNKGWTLAALADELGVAHNTVEKWKAGHRQPANAKAVYTMMDKIACRKRIPKKKRYLRKQ
jgi:transcriptional regulator with XRE-family HTH domain